MRGDRHADEGRGLGAEIGVSSTRATIEVRSIVLGKNVF